MGMKRLLSSGAAILFLALSAPASASCVCECVDGEPQNVCTYAYEGNGKSCSRVCSIPPAAIKPIDSPTIPPVGMKKCESRQVQNSQTNRYEWRQICE